MKIEFEFRVAKDLSIKEKMELKGILVKIMQSYFLSPIKIKLVSGKNIYIYDIKISKKRGDTK